MRILTLMMLLRQKFNYIKIKKKLLSLLKEFDYLFDATLVKWDTIPINLEFNTVYKPFNGIYYSVPEINKDTFCKEIQSIVDILVLTPVQKSQYVMPVFIIPKKGGTLRFILDYRNLNHQIVRNTYPLPRIVKTTQYLEGDQIGLLCARVM